MVFAAAMVVVNVVPRICCSTAAWARSARRRDRRHRGRALAACCLVALRMVRREDAG